MAKHKLKFLPVPGFEGLADMDFGCTKCQATVRITRKRYMSLIIDKERLDDSTFGNWSRCAVE